MEEIHVLSRIFQDLGDCLVIEQQVNAVHALGQEMFYLVEVGIANFEIFHSSSLR